MADDSYPKTGKWDAPFDDGSLHLAFSANIFFIRRRDCIYEGVGCLTARKYPCKLCSGEEPRDRHSVYIGVVYADRTIQKLEMHLGRKVMVKKPRYTIVPIQHYVVNPDAETEDPIMLDRKPATYVGDSKDFAPLPDGPWWTFRCGLCHSDVTREVAMETNSPPVEIF